MLFFATFILKCHKATEIAMKFLKMVSCPKRAYNQKKDRNSKQPLKEMSYARCSPSVNIRELPLKRCPTSRIVGLPPHYPEEPAGRLVDVYEYKGGMEKIGRAIQSALL